jgi:hypothetical protein
VGSQTVYYNEDNETDYELFIEYNVAVNRFSLPEAFNGTATAYVYAYNTDYWGKCKPVLFSDNNNSPLTRRCSNEGLFDIEVKSGKPAGWRSAAFQANASIASGSNIWFGFLSEWFAPRFDYGTKVYMGWYNEMTNPNANVPDTFPIAFANSSYNFKLSMYFTWVNAQNYVRTLTQGVSLTDSLKQKADYKKTLAQTAYGKTVSKSIVAFFRYCVMNVFNSMTVKRYPTFIRSAINNAGVTDYNSNKQGFSRLCDDIAKVKSVMSKNQIFLRVLFDRLSGKDTVSVPVLFVRTVFETQGITDNKRQWGNYFRDLYSEAGNRAETIRLGTFYRTESDTAQAQGFVFRGLLIFVKILTATFVRDFILRRFLIAREELVLKSCITRELILESKIN